MNYAKISKADNELPRIGELAFALKGELVGSDAEYRWYAFSSFSLREAFLAGLRTIKRSEMEKRGGWKNRVLNAMEEAQ